MLSYIKYKNRSIELGEDSLTSTVFDLLLCLPHEIYWNILYNAELHRKLPLHTGKLQSFEYWPKWNIDEDSREYREPDIFIRFEYFDLIIEAKLNNKNKQKEEQMDEQVKVYINLYKEDKKDLYYLKLDGLNDIEKVENKTVDNNEFIICKMDWASLLDQVINVLKNIESVKLQNIIAYKHILNQLILGLELHNHYKKYWLEELKPSRLSLNPKNLFSYAKQ